MKITFFNLLAIVLVWAVTVFAQSSSDSDSVYGVTPRDQDPAHVNKLLGINCRGSAFCTYPSCTFSLANIKKYIDTIDDKEEWGNGDQIACNLCTGCLPKYEQCAGLCAFPQKLGKDEKVNGSQIKSAIDALVKYKCGRCGSCPTKPGNNVGTGEITVNYVSSACNEGVCDYKRNAARDEVAAQVAPDQTIDQTIDQTADQSVDADIAIDTSPAQTADNIQTLGMGINCKGSSYCKYCRASLDQILETLDKMPDDLEFTEGEKIACQACNHEYIQGMCIFGVNLHRPIAARDVKVLVKRLRNNPCGRCGSVPLHVGEDVAQGRITANYVNRACAGKGHEKPRGCPKRDG